MLMETSKKLFLDDDILVLDFPYDKDEVAEIKAIDGAKWDKRRLVWTVPLRSLDAVRGWARRREFFIEADVMTLTLPEPPKASEVVKMGDDGKFIYLHFAYDPVKVRSVKQIPGITWDKTTAAWKAPLTSIEDVLKWSERFRLPVDEAVRVEATTTKELLSVLYEASRATDAVLDVPGLDGALLPYQKAGVAYAVSARKCFIADEMGLGKTIQAMASVEYLSQNEQVFPCLVVCPPNLVLNWKKEWARFFPGRSVQCITNRQPWEREADVVVVGYSNIHAHQSVLMKYKSFIFDESHYCKSKDAQRTKAAKKIVKSAGPGAPVFLLTGTPVTNKPMEYAPQLEIIGQIDKLGGLWGFYRRYCAAFRDKWGQWHLDGHSNLDELNDKLRSTCYIRRTKDQVMTELPPVIHDVVLIDGGALREYREAERDIVKYLVEKAEEIARELGKPVKSAAVRAKFAAQAHEHLVRLSVLRRLAAKAKISFVDEWIGARIEEGVKVVVAAHHREIVDLIAHKYGNLKIQGGMAVEDVEEAKQIFQDRPPAEAPVLVLSIQAAKTGHTLTASQNVLFVELPWTPADVDQTIARCHRLGQVGSVTATYLLVAGTIDEEIYDLITRKRAVVSQATDGVLWDDGQTVSETQLVFDLLRDVF